MNAILCKILATALGHGAVWPTRRCTQALYGCLILPLALATGGCGGSKEGPPPSNGGPPPASASGPSNEVLQLEVNNPIRAFVQRVMEHGQEFTEVNCKITALQRGEPFNDASIRDLPSGHKVFPVRLTVEGSVKQPDARVREIVEKLLNAPTLQPVEVKGMIEMVLYQNAFGEWQTRSVKTEALRFRVDNGQWEPAPQ